MTVPPERSDPRIEIDSLFHGPNWTQRESFLADVEVLTKHPEWVTEWQYSAARPLLSERAEVLVWLDLPFATVTLPQVVRRTVSRRVRREELWNGNIEGPLWTFFTDREHIVRWSWRTRHNYRKWLPTVEQEFPHLVIVRLRSRRDVEMWLARLRQSEADPQTNRHADH